MQRGDKNKLIMIMQTSTSQLGWKFKRKPQRKCVSQLAKSPDERRFEPRTSESKAYGLNQCATKTLMTDRETFIYLTFTLPTGCISNTLNENNIDLSFHSDDGQIVKPLLSNAILRMQGIVFFNKATLANKHWSIRPTVWPVTLDWRVIQTGQKNNQ